MVVVGGALTRVDSWCPVNVSGELVITDDVT